MHLADLVIIALVTRLVGSSPGGPNVPGNITITFLNPTSVKVSWTTTVENVDKYDVTYKPTDASYRVVAVVAGNSNAVTLSGLKEDTQYHLTVAAIWGGKRYRSRPIVFRTLEPPRSFPHQDPMATLPSEMTTTRKADSSSDHTEEYSYPLTSSTVRGVEIGIVLLVLLVWIAAIALFFNRWGKIRMLLPYQPDYNKDQLKVPGTSATAANTANTCAHHHSGDHICSQAAAAPAPAVDRKHRKRTNSAIFMSSSGPGFDSKEFFRRHGSVSILCRKACSVDNISNEDGKPHQQQQNNLQKEQIYKNHQHHLQQPSHHVQRFGILPALSVSEASPPPIHISGDNDNNYNNDNDNEDDDDDEEDEDEGQFNEHQSSIILNDAGINDEADDDDNDYDDGLLTEEKKLLFLS